MEPVFRSGFLWILLAAVVYGVLHSIMAANRVKARAQRTLGERAYRRYYRLFFAAMAGVTFLPLLALVALLPDRPIYTIPFPWSLGTFVFQALAATGITIGVLQTGAMKFLGIEQALRDDPQYNAPRPERLVVDGLYRWTRHPLYTFSFLLIWLSPVMTWNILALNIGLSAYMLIGSIFEERKLIEQFGQKYIDYRSRTGRIFPKIRLSR